MGKSTQKVKQEIHTKQPTDVIQNFAQKFTKGIAKPIIH